MLETPIVLNERDARRARTKLSDLNQLLSANTTLERAASDFPSVVLEMHQRAIASDRSALESALSAYEKAKSGDSSELLSKWRHDPGVALIVARIARGLSQSDLAARMNMPEQQVQRYEAERYRSISLQNFSRMASGLGVKVQAAISADGERWGAHLSDNILPAPSREELRPVVDHATRNAWFSATETTEDLKHRLIDFVWQTNGRYGNPALLRTGLGNLDLTKDFLLAAWRARVIWKAQSTKTDVSTEFEPTDISWVKQLVSLSAFEDGPRRALDMLSSRGVAVVVEPHIKGLRLDGAAFLVDGVPVIGLTLRNDRIDGFWYTLLHELGHVFLHRLSGLASGFCDDLEREQVDDLEKEANNFASAMLISPEIWNSSPARIARTTDVIREFAKSIGVHPAIVFGKIRHERNDYRVFSDQVGSGQVRAQLLQG